MADTLLTRDEVADLLIDTRTGRCQALAPDRRERLVACLDRILVREDVLFEHVRLLQQLKVIADGSALGDDAEAAVATSGTTQGLDDRALAALALDQLSLLSLRDRIAAELSPAWLEAIVADGTALCSEHGVEFHPPAAPAPAEAVQQGALRGPVSEPTTSTAALQRRWQFSVRGEQCRWGPSVPPDSPAGDGFTVLVEWRADGVLQIGITGKMRLAKGVALTVIWSADAGAVRASGSLSDRNEPIRLPSSVPPACGDRLQFVWSRGGAEAHWEVAIPPEPDSSS